MPSCCRPVPAAPAPCCQPAQKPQTAQKRWTLSQKIEHICATALAIFAALSNLPLFGLSLLAGATYQCIKIAFTVKQEGHGTQQRPGCGQGFGELVSQLKLLSPEIVLATAYVAWRHLMHDPQGFVPFVGFFVGMGVAHQAMNYFGKKV